MKSVGMLPSQGEGVGVSKIPTEEIVRKVNNLPIYYMISIFNLLFDFQLVNP